MITPAGADIGEAWRTEGPTPGVRVGAVLVGSDPEVAARGPFTLELDLADGGTVHRGDRHRRGRHDLGRRHRPRRREIAAVSLVDADGRVWCTGRFA